jgi:hypothetical protein
MTNAGTRHAKRTKTQSIKRMMNGSKVAEELLNDFLQHARALGGDVEPIKVLRSNTYRIGNSHVLARVAADTGKYFFGLNYINAEEVANLDNAFIAFVCGDVSSSVIMPMSELLELLPQISHDRNGEFKINITKGFELALKGRGNRKPLREFLNKWDSIASPGDTAGEVTSAEQSFQLLPLSRPMAVLGRTQEIKTPARLTQRGVQLTHSRPPSRKLRRGRPPHFGLSACPSMSLGQQRVKS